MSLNSTDQQTGLAGLRLITEPSSSSSSSSTLLAYRNPISAFSKSLLLSHSWPVSHWAIWRLHQPQCHRSSFWTIIATVSISWSVQVGWTWSSPTHPKCSPTCIFIWHYSCLWTASSFTFSLSLIPILSAYKSNTVIGSRAFKHCSPEIWNIYSLPVSLRDVIVFLLLDLHSRHIFCRSTKHSF